MAVARQVRAFRFMPIAIITRSLLKSAGLISGVEMEKRPLGLLTAHESEKAPVLFSDQILDWYFDVL